MDYLNEFLAQPFTVPNKGEQTVRIAKDLIRFYKRDKEKYPDSIASNVNHNRNKKDALPKFDSLELRVAESLSHGLAKTGPR